MPPPFAAYSPDAITIGSASKSFWGGLRLGWVRAPHDLDGHAHPGAGQPRPRARPCMEQLVLTSLLDGLGRDPDRAPAPAARAARRPGRGRRASSCRLGVPASRPAAWRCGAGCPRRWAPPWRSRPRSRASSSRPGPVFAAEGGLDRFVRIPWSTPAGRARGGGRAAGRGVGRGRGSAVEQRRATPRDGRLSRRQSRSTARADVASMACSISASVSAGSRSRPTARRARRRPWRRGRPACRRC